MYIRLGGIYTEQESRLKKGKKSMKIKKNLCLNDKLNCELYNQVYP